MSIRQTCKERYDTKLGLDGKGNIVNLKGQLLILQIVRMKCFVGLFEEHETQSCQVRPFCFQSKSCRLLRSFLKCRNLEMTAYRGAGIIVSRADSKFYNPKKGSKI